MNFERFSELWDKHVKNNPNMDYTPNPDMEPYKMSEKTKKALIAYGQGDTSYFDKLEEQIKERKSEANNVAVELKKVIECVEIYEGDIVNCYFASRQDKVNIGIVEFCPKYGNIGIKIIEAGIHVNAIKTPKPFFNFINNDGVLLVEIIGNKFENPELMK